MAVRWIKLLVWKRRY